MAGYNYYAVEGPIGVGKSIIAKAIAKKTNARIIETPVEENPFLENFYRDPFHFAFVTQVYFLLSRYRLLTSLFDIDLFHQVVVSDFIFERDGLFARLLLDEPEYRLYCQVEQQLRKDLPKPQIVILLQAPIEVIMRNIFRRGRQFEKRNMTDEFIGALVREYTSFFFNWRQTPLLVVDVGSIDIDDPQKLSELVDYIIETPITGMQFYSAAMLL